MTLAADPPGRRVIEDKVAHLIQVRHRDEVEAPVTEWLHEAYHLQDTPAAKPVAAKAARKSAAKPVGKRGAKPSAKRAPKPVAKRARTRR